MKAREHVVDLVGDGLHRGACQLAVAESPERGRSWTATASRSQYGAPGPPKAGTMWTPSAAGDRGLLPEDVGVDAEEVSQPRHGAACRADVRLESVHDALDLPGDGRADSGRLGRGAVPRAITDDPVP